MQEKLIENLDLSLEKILDKFGMGFYTHNFDYYLLDKSKMKGNGESYSYKGKKFIQSQGLFKQIRHHYQPNIKVEKDSRSIFIHLIESANENERKYLINHYEYFVTFDQALNYFIKVEKNKEAAILFVTRNALKGRLREVDKEEKLLIKIKNLDVENYYGNLLSYLSNHSDIYTKSIYSSDYQGMLKNLISEYLPEKRKNFALFTGDSNKKYLSHSSILHIHDEKEFEEIIKFNKTVIEENYIPEDLKEKHEISKEQGKFIKQIPELLKISKKLNLKNIYPIYTEDKEILNFYVIKQNEVIDKNEIVKYLEVCLCYWKDNVNKLKVLDERELLSEISKNAEIIYWHNQLNDKLSYKDKSNYEKKVKI